MFPQKDDSRVVLTQLASYLVLDALVCNVDRHHENWGLLWQVVVENDDFRETPVFFVNILSPLPTITRHRLAGNSGMKKGVKNCVAARSKIMYGKAVVVFILRAKAKEQIHYA